MIYKALKKEKALVGPFSEHCETRRIVASSILELIQSECGWARVGAAADESVSTQHSALGSWCGPGGRAGLCRPQSFVN